jgi:hypothetical protein
MLQPSPNKLVKLSPGELTLAEETKDRIKAIRRAWKATIEANRRGALATVIFGIYLVETRAWGERTGAIRHGQFLPWLEKQTPDIHHATAYRWMEVATAVLETLQISHRAKFDDTLLHQALTLPEKRLTPDQSALRKALFDLVDGKSMKQLRFELCDVEPAGKGGFPIKPGLFEKWIKKNHPELIGPTGELPTYDSLPAKLKKEYRQYQIDHAPRASAKEQAEALMAQGRENVEEVELKISILILQGSAWTHADTAQLKSLLDRGEEMTALLRKALKEK